MRFRPDENRPAPIDIITDVQKQKIMSTLILHWSALMTGVASAGTRWVTQSVIPLPIISEQFHALQARNEAFYQWIYSVPDFASLLVVSTFFLQITTLISAILHTNEDRAFENENEFGYRNRKQYNQRLRLHEKRLLLIELGEILAQLTTTAAVAWMFISQELDQFAGVIYGTPQKDDLEWYARGVIVVIVYMLVQRLVLYGSSAYRLYTQK